MVKLFANLVVVIAFGIYGVVNADTVITRDGAILIGKVTVITPVSVTMDTSYAGTIVVALGQIADLSTDSSLTAKLTDGTEVSGITVIREGTNLTIKSSATELQTSVDNLLAAWIPDKVPPTAAGYRQPRRWTYTAAADITGKKGNTEENGTAVQAQTALVGDNDELRFYGSVDFSEQDGEDTANEIILGVYYVSYFSDVLGWFVNTEFEHDPFENIDLRSTFSGGLSYWLFNQPGHRLEFQTGVGYRHESFNDDTSQESPIVDINLHHIWQINSWMRMTNNLSYSPSISDLKDFLMVQDSGINMPIGGSNWGLRLGLKNHYKNLPTPGIKKLDTTYYSRLVLNFN